MAVEQQIVTRLGPIQVRVIGDGRPAVLWPSLFVDMGSWRRIVDDLAAERRLVLIDGPGHGRSGDPGRRYTMTECVGAAVEVLDALAITGPVDWVGNAWGGHVGIIAAADHPTRVRSLVSISAPVAAYTAAERRRTRILLTAYRMLGPAQFIRSAVVETLLAPATRANDPEAVAYVDSQFRDADRRQLRNAVESISLGRHDITALLPRIGVPTLFATGADSTGFTPAQAATAITQVPGGTVAIVPDSAYLPPLEQPREMARLILDFWATQD